MSGTRFEDLQVWKRSRELTAAIYRLTRSDALVSDPALCGQMRRAAVSVMSNIAEGYERGGNRELVNFLSIAKGSVGELRSQVYVAEDSALLDKQCAARLRSDCLALSRLLAGFIRYLQQSQYKGYKFRHTKPDRVDAP
ncbi:four helix bundle protein [Thioalkalivibrio thiocyanodenitrificans]|uniref:four helix bundle protein n=1 Tax=Thioalkalivibrio thiocyanodenitrificans TaxID=243063 RepID=UPI00036EF570|nr:four helix bundle protein [Thioalkalivibrio thiocyanodenitrificans]